MHKHARESIKPQLSVPDKLFYKIGEVSRITGVESYVLRYWESEFPFLKPRKNKSGQRVYVRKDLEQILIIKRLLYQERLTIEGVRKRLGESQIKSSESSASHEVRLINSTDPAEVIASIRKRLRQIADSIK